MHGYAICQVFQPYYNQICYRLTVPIDMRLYDNQMLHTLRPTNHIFRTPHVDAFKIITPIIQQAVKNRIDCNGESECIEQVDEYGPIK